MLRNLRRMFNTGDVPNAGAGFGPTANSRSPTSQAPNLVTCSTLGQTLVVTVVDPELNAFKAADVNHEIRRLMSETPNVRHLVIDMGNIEFLDSAGLNAFVDLLSVVKQTGGHIAVAAATQQVEVLFKLTRLELVFMIRRTVIEAIDAIEKIG